MSIYSRKSMKRFAVLILLVFTTLVLTSLVIFAEGSTSDSTVDWERNTQNGETNIDGNVDNGSGMDFGSTTFESAEPTSPPVESNSNGQAEPALIAVLAGVLGLGVLTGSMLKRSQIDALMPQGNGIWVPDEDREDVLKMINSIADKEYAIDANGFVKETGKEKSGSSTYSTIIDALINSDKKTVIGIDSGWVAYDGSDTERIDFGATGNGVNVGDNDTDQVAVISGKDDTIKDVDGNDVYNGANMILAHELVHAARGVYSKKTEGTSVDATREEEAYTIELENIIRTELQFGLRGDGSSLDDVNQDGIADGNDTYGSFTSNEIDTDWYKPLFEGDNGNSNIYNMDESGIWVSDGDCLYDSACGSHTENVTITVYDHYEDVVTIGYDSYCEGHFEDTYYDKQDGYCIQDNCNGHTEATYQMAYENNCIYDPCNPHYINYYNIIPDGYCIQDNCNGHTENTYYTVNDGYCIGDGSCGHFENKYTSVQDTYCIQDNCNGHTENTYYTVNDGYCIGDSCGHYENKYTSVQDTYCVQDNCNGHTESTYYTVNDGYCIGDSCGHYGQSYHTVYYPTYKVVSDGYCAYISDGYCNSDSCTHQAVLDSGCKYVTDGYCNSDSCYHSAILDSYCTYVSDGYCNADSTSCTHQAVLDSGCKYVTDGYCNLDSCYHNEILDSYCTYVSDGYCLPDSTSCTHQALLDSGCTYVTDGYCNFDTTCYHQEIKDSACELVYDGYCIADSLCAPHEEVLDGYCKYVTDGYCNGDSCYHKEPLDSYCYFTDDWVDSYCNPHEVTEAGCKHVIDGYCTIITGTVEVPDAYCVPDGSCNKRFVYYLGALNLSSSVSDGTIYIDVSCEHADHMYVTVTNEETGESEGFGISGPSGQNIGYRPPTSGTYTITVAARNTPSDTDQGTQRKTTTQGGIVVVQGTGEIKANLVSLGYLSASQINSDSAYDSAVMAFLNDHFAGPLALIEFNKAKTNPADLLQYTKDALAGLYPDISISGGQTTDIPVTVSVKTNNTDSLEISLTSDESNYTANIPSLLRTSTTATINHDLTMPGEYIVSAYIDGRWTYKTINVDMGPISEAFGLVVEMDRINDLQNNAYQLIDQGDTTNGERILKECALQKLLLMNLLLDNQFIQNYDSITKDLASHLLDDSPYSGGEINSLIDQLSNSNAMIKDKFDEWKEEKAAEFWTMLLNLIPGINLIKAISEGFEGIEWYTGRQKEWWECALDITCSAIAIGGIVANVAKGELVASLSNVLKVTKNFGYSVVKELKALGDEALKAVATYGEEALRLIRSYGDNAVKAITNGIEPSLISNLEKFGIKVTDFERFGIISREAAETVAEGLEFMGNIAARYSDDVMHYIYKPGIYIPTPVTLSNYEMLDEIATNMYSSFRSSTDDVLRIAQNTGWNVSDIEQIKRYLFLDELRLDDGIRLLDPDYEIAKAWERMASGEFYQNDILLLKHELYESTYYKTFNTLQRAAHDEANKIFNWQNLIESLRQGGN